jgi:hypothetical protein
MQSFDPYECVLRNFSKHKFKTYIEHSILDLSTYPPEHVSEAGMVHTNRWEAHDLAEMSMPTQLGLMFGVTSYNRWVFQLDHTDDGLIDPDMLWDYAAKRITDLATSLAAQREYVEMLATELYDRVGTSVMACPMHHNPVYGKAIYYYLTNALLDPFCRQDAYEALQSKVSEQIESIFHRAAGQYGIDISKASFGFGFGSPIIFRHQRPEFTAELIRKIDARPDSIGFRYTDGRVRIVCANKRLLTAYDRDHPRFALLDEVVDPQRFYAKEEIQELEELINRPGVRELELQLFLEAHPKFLLYGDYDEVSPQVILVDEDNKELRPDFFLRPSGRNLWEIMDIKLPAVDLLAGPKNRKCLSSSVHRGVSQLMQYARFFENPRNRDRVFRETGIDCFKPRLTLVIGKKSNVDEALWNQIIEQERPFVHIMGFDEMLDRARKYALHIPA